LPSPMKQGHAGWPESDSGHDASTLANRTRRKHLVDKALQRRKTTAAVELGTPLEMLRAGFIGVLGVVAVAIEQDVETRLAKDPPVAAAPPAKRVWNLPVIGKVVW
jgi:hypothetical protein